MVKMRCRKKPESRRGCAFWRILMMC